MIHLHSGDAHLGMELLGLEKASVGRWLPRGQSFKELYLSPAMCGIPRAPRPRIYGRPVTAQIESAGFGTYQPNRPAKSSAILVFLYLY